MSPHQYATLFMGSLRLRSEDGSRYPTDSRQFALAVNQLWNNDFARCFVTVDGPTGWVCPLYMDMVSIAHQNLFIQYCTPSYTHFQFLVTSEVCPRLLVHFPRALILAASELVESFLIQ